jgi:hypothetical protein
VCDRSNGHAAHGGVDLGLRTGAQSEAAIFLLGKDKEAVSPMVAGYGNTRVLATQARSLQIGDTALSRPGRGRSPEKSAKPSTIGL